MSIYGAIAENTRRNERVDRGVITVTGSATIGFTSSQTVNLTPAYGSVGGMRQITHFEVCFDDGGTAFTTIDPIALSAGLNAAGTILTINVYKATASGNVTLTTSATATKVRYTVWGNLSGTGGTYPQNF